MGKVKQVILAVAFCGCVSEIDPLSPTVETKSVIKPVLASYCMATYPSLSMESGKGIFRQKWSVKGLNKELITIAKQESNMGMFLDHKPSVRGDYFTAFGPLGFKPSTAHVEYRASGKLKWLYPGLNTEQAFLLRFISDPSFYNKLANTHWDRIKAEANGDVAFASFGWRWGIEELRRSSRDVVLSDEYVARYAQANNLFLE